MLTTAVALFVALFFYIVFGLLFPLNGILMMFAPNVWTRLPRYLRPRRIPIGTAWSESRSSKIQMRALGLMYIGLGAMVHYFLISALRTK